LSPALLHTEEAGRKPPFPARLFFALKGGLLGFREQAAKNQRDGQAASEQRSVCPLVVPEQMDEQQETPERGVESDQDQRVCPEKGQASLLAQPVD
jgi:hypothetical protein